MEIFTNISGVLLPALFFSLLSLARFTINIGFVERPIVAGLLWGAVIGDFTIAISLAVFYELFWLDLFPTGTYIPPNPLFPMFTVFCIAGTQPQPDASTLFLPVLFTLFLGPFGAWLEKIHREWQISSYDRLLRHFRGSHKLNSAAKQAITSSIAQLFLFNLAAFLLVASLCLIIINIARASFSYSFVFPGIPWALVWAFGLAGGILSLRIRQSYAVFFTGSVGFAVVILFGYGLH